MRRSAICMSLLAAATGAALAAGQVEVTFKPLDELSDAGRGSFDGERNLQALAAHFKALAPRLPDGQLLKVEVLDLNLAGEMKPLRRGAEVRVLKGSVDWPSMSLRWSLNADGRPIKSADERVSDMAYLMHPIRGGNDGPLTYEGRMIDRWFGERFGSNSSAAR